MTYLADLHMHSTASDGQYRPAELVRLAKEKGLQVMAITDHDSIGGIKEAAVEGEKIGLKVISGVEMSAREYHTFHILGYCFDPSRLAQAEFFQGLEKGRAKRSVRIMDYLRSKGVDFPLEEVQELAEGGTIGRPHFARVMLKRGICQSWEEAFGVYLDSDEFHSVVEDKPEAVECIAAVHGSGGIVSLAHPYQIGIDNDALDALMCRMKEWGLDAIECYYSKHTPEQTAFYLELAKKYGLHVTGGSDFHGEKIKPDIQMTSLELELDWLLGR